MSIAQVPTVTVDAVPTGAPLLDVREPDEWAAGRAEEAMHVPLGEVVGRVPEIAELAERAAEGRVYVLCKVGGRSAQATAYLRQQGVEAVNVDGGMQSWQAAGRPLTGDADDPFVL